MGADYSMCLGYERNKQAKEFEYQTPGWPNGIVAATPGGDNARIIPVKDEESHLKKKQRGLNLQFIQCTKLK